MTYIKRLVRICISRVLHLMPPGMPALIYIRFLRVRPLRAVTNSILKAILPKTVAVAGGVLHINAHDPVVSGALALGVYDPFETKLFQSLLKPGMTVLDMGANIGYFTTLAARAVGNTGRVIAFEPEPTNFSFLQKNISANGYSWVTPMQVALSDKKGTLMLHLSEINKGRHSILQPYTKEFTSSMEIETTTVDAALDSLHIKYVDFIKIDIEGAETLALSGMTKVLAQENLILTVEFSPSAIQASGTTPQRFIDRLRSYGFKVYDIPEKAGAIEEIADTEKFVREFPADLFTNLLCTKTAIAIDDAGMPCIGSAEPRAKTLA